MAAIRFCILFFCLFFLSVYSVKNIKNTSDLKNVKYGRPAPRHGLQMLFWFAQRVLFDQNNILIINPNVDVRRGDFGFHRFANRESILPSLSSQQSYYITGNLNYPGASALPDFVRRYYTNINVPERNMDRLIVSVNQNSPNRIRNLFITSHNRGRNDFNHSDTYEIDPEFISQIRQPSECSLDQNNNYVINNQLQEITEEERCRRFLIQTEYLSSDCTHISHRKKRSTFFHCDVYEEIEQQLKAPNQGNTKLVYLYRPEFDGANRVIPTRIKGFNASLQLYAEDEKACARLYIKKTFSNWKDVFHYSWVGFYKGSQDKNDDYSTYQYAVNFALIDSTSRENYDIYQFKSELAVAPGVQIRFLLDKKYDKVLAQTTPWEGDEKCITLTAVCKIGNPTCPNPEFFSGPEFHDANNVIPIQISNYDAYLQLFTKDGKACARLYIKKTFTDWKDTFYYSWVGFYTSSKYKDRRYSTYQYAVNFDKMEDSTENFDIYEYKSDLDITSGIQIRFFMDKDYNEVEVTVPWSID